jgi:glycosyltransferase involved in cell wall biosynthesis
VLVAPTSEQGFIDGLAEAMLRLASSSELRKSLGEGGKKRVRRDGLDWNSKADRVFAILTEVTSHSDKTASPA